MHSGIIDLIIRIKNGYLSKKEVIYSPYSKFREEVLKKLVELGYVKEYSLDEANKNEIQIVLNYSHGESKFTDVKIYSKPGRRWYVTKHDLKPVLSGMGYSFVSTSKGIMTNIEAKNAKIGGELLFDIW